jgi:uncharacterized alkaline shock family protein YloU
MKVFEVLQSAADITMKQIKNHKDLARKLGISIKELTKLSDEEIETILKNIGKHDFVPDSNFNKNELKKGIKVEREHTNSLLVAKLVATDHLVELPDYYTRLEKMEKR